MSLHPTLLNNGRREASNETSPSDEVVVVVLTWGGAIITPPCLYVPQAWRAPLMLCGQMLPLMPALQPPSVSRWQRATAATGPWRSCCTLVVREWGAQWTSSDLFQDHLGSSFSSIGFWAPRQEGQVICEGGPDGTGKLDLQGLSQDSGTEQLGSRDRDFPDRVVFPPPQSPTSPT